MNVFLAVLWKDLLTEWRSRDRVVAMVLFSLLVVVAFHFSLPGGATRETAENAPGLLWVATIFAAVLGLNRAFSVELENDALSAIAAVPTDRGWVFLGKAAANWIILSVVQLLTLLAFGLVFEIALLPVAAPLALVAALGGLGLCAIGTLFAAVAVRTRFREVMLPLLMLPLVIPVLAGAARATAALLAGETLPFDALQLLIVADAVYLIVAFLGFDYVLDE